MPAAKDHTLPARNVQPIARSTEVSDHARESLVKARAIAGLIEALTFDQCQNIDVSPEILNGVALALDGFIAEAIDTLS